MTTNEHAFREHLYAFVWLRTSSNGLIRRRPSALRKGAAGFVLLTSLKNKYRARLTFAALYIKLYCTIYVLRAALNKALIGKSVYSRTAPAAVAPPAPSTEFLGRSGRYTGAHPPQFARNNLRAIFGIKSEDLPAGQDGAIPDNDGVRGRAPAI